MDSLSLAGTNFHGPNPVRAIEVLMYAFAIHSFSKLIFFFVVVFVYLSLLVPFKELTSILVHKQCSYHDFCSKGKPAFYLDKLY